jgi:hypothetical protein
LMKCGRIPCLDGGIRGQIHDPRQADCGVPSYSNSGLNFDSVAFSEVTTDLYSAKFDRNRPSLGRL